MHFYLKEISNKANVEGSSIDSTKNIYNYILSQQAHKTECPSQSVQSSSSSSPSSCSSQFGSYTDSSQLQNKTSKEIKTEQIETSELMMSDERTNSPDDLNNLSSDEFFNEGFDDDNVIKTECNDNMFIGFKASHRSTPNSSTSSPALSISSLNSSESRNLTRVVKEEKKLIKFSIDNILGTQFKADQYPETIRKRTADDNDEQCSKRTKVY